MTIPSEPTDVRPPVGVRAPRAWLAGSDAPRLDLSGTWRFRIGAAAPADQGEGWGSIEVPGHWQLQGHGGPAYTNVTFPIPVDPPRVPVGPVGEYRTRLVVPADWPEGRLVLRFEGVDSWFAVAVNGTWLATSHGSRLPTEIDLTEALRPGENVLAVRVHQWSAQTYVEDQDQWWLSGIFRRVLLLHRPEGGVEDLRLEADYDADTGLGALAVHVRSDLPARVTVPELGIDVAAGTRVEVPVEPWSAEVPRLYTATVATAAERVELAVGFRRVSATGGVLTLNGRPLTLRGVNRHEFEPTRGRAVTAEDMLADVVLMKQHHVNAVRTSHYPPHPDFLDLCDRYGLYVMVENDLETHGFELVDWRGNPTDDPAWTDVLVDRMRRTVARDAHHPSVVMWSLGNESGTGRNLAAMAAAARELDPRPLHYEGARDCVEVDVYSRMYASVAEVEQIGRGVEAPLPDAATDARRRALPFVLCEYAHAMGNGPGGLSAYDTLADTYPRLAGGFVWEWIDHGLATTTDDGTPFFAYGGDFGEEVHDGAFVADGLLLPDRTPSPGLLELAEVYAPAQVRVGPRIEIRNRFAFRAVSAATWQVRVDGAVVATGDLALDLAPGERCVLPVPEAAASAAAAVPADRAVHLRVTVRSTEPPAAWEPAGGLALGEGEGRLRPAAPRRVSPHRAPAPVPEDDGLRVGPVLLGPHGPTALGGLGLAACGVHAWRAPTDNDLGEAHGLEPAAAAVWRRDGLDLLRESAASVERVGDAVEVRTRAAGPGVDRGLAATYRWHAVDEATVDLDLTVDPWGPWNGPWPRIGLRLGLRVPDPAAAVVTWWGLGPGEAYPDSARAVRYGRWRASVADLQTRYTRPQENGARRGVERAVVATTAGTVTVDLLAAELGGHPQDGMVLTVRPWSDRELDRAAHPHELVPGLLWVHLDVAHHGLGSASCGEGVQPEAVLHPAPARLRVRLSVDATAAPGTAR